MNPQATGHVEAARAGRRTLGGPGSLHGYHRLVIGLSLLVTPSARWFSRGLVKERAATRFERETEHLVELVTERTDLDLERFACVVRHDPKTPLRGIGDLARYLDRPDEIPRSLTERRDDGLHDSTKVAA